MKWAIEIDNVSKEYPGVTALKKISLHVRKGSLHGFLGPNGAGKTTTMKIIAGLIPPTYGTVKILGKNIRHHLDEVKCKIGFMSENLPLYKNMKVEDFLQFIAKINNVNKKSLKRYFEETVSTCCLEKIVNKRINTLSKGFRQRVGLAQALIYKPEIIILDEPTIGLDPSAIVEIRKLIKSLKDKHTILLSSHHLYDVEQICSDITIINNGCIVKSGHLKNIQKSLKSRQVIKAVVNKWNKSIEDEIEKRAICEEYEISQHQGKFHIKFYSKPDKDMRELLSQTLIHENCGLFSFQEVEMDLENIFNKVTQNEKEAIL